VRSPREAGRLAIGYYSGVRSARLDAGRRLVGPAFAGRYEWTRADKRSRSVAPRRWRKPSQGNTREHMGGELEVSERDEGQPDELCRWLTTKRLVSLAMLGRRATNLKKAHGNVSAPGGLRRSDMWFGPVL